MTEETQKTNSALVYSGAFLFVLNIITFVFLIYFDQLENVPFAFLLILILVGVVSVIISACWYRHDEKLRHGTVIPLLAIILSFFLMTQEWKAFKTVDKPSTGIDGKKISGFD